VKYFQKLVVNIFTRSQHKTPTLTVKVPDTSVKWHNLNVFFTDTKTNELFLQ